MEKRILLRPFLLWALATGLAAPLRADDYSQWGESAPVYLKTTPDGANVAGTVRNFPILIRLTKAGFPFAEAKGKGQDIRFSASDGKHLRYQIDRWDSAAGLAEIWVKMDSVKGNASDQSLTMLWGNAAAADSSDGNAVFDGASGFAAVWHMGWTGASPRKNSVAGGFDADPLYLDGGETVGGMIGTADSLDGDSPYGDNFQVGDGYEFLADGFTFSIWCHPTSAANASRLMDFGNGNGLDEMVLARSGISESIVFENYAGTSKGKTLKVDNCFPLRQWQQFTITVSNGKAAIYRNGALIGTDDLGNLVTPVRRAFNYLGRNDWNWGSYFQGMLDEAVLSKVVRSADWIKLGYANQGPGQSLVHFEKPDRPAECVSGFSVSGDTAISEGSVLVLRGTAACATGYSWSSVSGPAPRILDPEVKALEVFLPRLARDTSIVFRFSAVYGDSERRQDVKVTVKADVPDPILEMPAAVDWNGKDSLMIRPIIPNLAEVKASRQPVLNWDWETSGPVLDTGWRSDGLMLKSASSDGEAEIRLCVDNNGPTACGTVTVKVRMAVGLAPAAGAPPAPWGMGRSGYDLRGRVVGIAPDATSTSASSSSPVFPPRGSGPPRQ